MKKSLLFAVCLLGLSASAQTTVFSHYDGSSELNMIGTQKTETYDVAMLVSNPGLVGTKIVGLRVYTADATNLTDTKVFLTSELKLKPEVNKKVNDADILTQQFTPQSNTWNEITLSEPYEITEDGVYVGYSLTTTSASGENAKPIATVTGAEANSLFFHTSRTYRSKWGSYTNSYGARLAMEVLVTGLPENAATLELDDNINILTNDRKAVFPATIRNNGSAAINSIEYVYNLAGETPQTKELSFRKPVAARYNAANTIEVPVPLITEKGSYTFSVQLTKVNGTAVTAPPSTGTISVYKTLTKHRAVVEEYTGTWCGYCPRGMVGLKKMNALYPNDFIGISYHNGDPMTITNDYPSNIQGFPDAWIDRVRETDAFLGDGKAYPGPFGLDKVWLARCEELSPASVDVEASLEGNTVNVKSYIAFPVNTDASHYRLAYALTHDGMTGTGNNWMQSNYYGGSGFTDPDMQPFVNGGSYVSVVYDDVLVYTSGNKGISGSLPEQAMADEVIEHTYSIPLSNVKNINNASLVQDTKKMHAVVLLIDSNTGYIANAHKVRLGESTRTGITSLTQSGSRSADTYDLSGRRVTSASKGVYIIGGKKVMVK